MWVTKSYDKFQQEYRIQSKLLEVKGVSHHLEIFTTEDFGEIALLDDNVLLQNTLFTQSELLAHIGACSHKNPKRVLIMGSFNVEIAFEFLKHNLQVDFLQFDLKILESLISFFPHYKAVMDSANFTHIPQQTKEFLAQNTEKNPANYDVIVCLEKVDFASLKELLSEDGILITQAPNILLETQKLENALKDLGDFRVKMPFFAPLALQQDCYIFASKLYHPTADIQLQRADMLEDLRYYHANLHLSAFVLPKEVKNALFGIARN